MVKSRQSMPSTDIRSHTVPNLIQGISQQAANERRDTQCEDQQDSWNDPRSGCGKRAPMELVGFYSGANWLNRRVVNLHRSDTENYLVALGAAAISAVNVTSGVQATIVDADSSLGYLTGDTNGKSSISVAFIEDTLFVASGVTVPSMAAATPAPTYKEAIVAIKQGAYSEAYSITVRYGGNAYKYTYTTPDNSVSGNAAYITTGQIAATLFRAMSGSTASSQSLGEGSNSSYDGSTSGTSAPGGTLAALGFQLAINGSVIRIRHPSADFSIDVAGPGGDTLITCAKEKVQSFSSLPNKAFTAFTTKVAGEDTSEADDWYTHYVVRDGTGMWEETYKLGEPTTPNLNTWPHILVSDSLNHFTWSKASFENRLVGDIYSDKTPYFVGQPIKDIAYDHSRLLIITEASATWSKSRNPNLFFRDTVQTVLETDPINFKIASGLGSSMLRRIVLGGEGTFLWAPRAQFRATSGQDPFTQASVALPLGTTYEFDEVLPPLALGDSLYFTTPSGSWSAVRQLTIRDGKPVGDADDLTEHVHKLVPQGLDTLLGSDTAKCLILGSEDRSDIYCYQWWISDNKRVQAAWNRWNIPCGGTLLGGCVKGNVAWLLLQYANGVALVKLDMTPGAGSDVGYLDLRETAPAMSYNSSTNRTRVTYKARAASATGLRPCLVNRSSERYGHIYEPLAVTDTYADFEDDLTTESVYFGFRYASYRDESPFFVRGSQGTTSLDNVTVTSIVIAHSDTVTYRVEVTLRVQGTEVNTFEGASFDDPASGLDVLPKDTGTLEVPIGGDRKEVSRIRLINDSPYPSFWQSMEWRYTAVSRAVNDGLTNG